MLGWYNRKIEDAMLTGPDKVVLVGILFIATATCWTLAALFVYVLPQFVSGELVFLFATKPQRVAFLLGFIVFLGLLGLVCCYTAIKFIKKETIS